MEIGELCKRNNRKKRGKLSFHHNNYGTLFQYSECIVILIWPVIQEHIKYAVIWREPCLRLFYLGPSFNFMNCRKIIMKK